MKKELLSPAGNMESLKSAVHNGCDAIYLAGNLYGARKFAKNFNNEELIAAVNYCHLYGVKIYITVNTLIYESEINACLKYLEFLYNIGVDAVIVQDLGLIKLIHDYLPNLAIHASTQAHTHNLEQIKLLERLGVKRVVLARELSIAEINNLDTNTELEIFIHGALCICYSGQCLMSSFVLNRSGNRGECAGLCRVLYNLNENDKTILNNKYLLSPRELNTTDYIKELLHSKACSFKIEGRMKSPEYVGYVTRIYRKLLDNPNYKLSSEEIFNLKSLYNRGFTKGYLFNNSDFEFISLNSSNHEGVEIGNIIGFVKNKIKIKLTHELNQGDAIRLPNNEGMYVNFLYNEQDNLINKGEANSIVLIPNKTNLKKLGTIKLTINKKLLDEIKKTPERKIALHLFVSAQVNEPLTIKYSDNYHTVSFGGSLVEKSLTMPLTKERLTVALTKLGSTPFKVNDIKINVDSNIFIPIKTLNNIRRDLCTKLIAIRTSTPKPLTINYKPTIYNRSKDKIQISAKVRTEEQLLYLLDKIDYLYIIDDNLYQKYQDNPKVFKVLDRIKNTHESYHHKNLLIGETGSLFYSQDNFVCTDYYLNIVNSPATSLLNELNVQRITISPEVSIENLKELLTHLASNIATEIIIYGSLEYMIMKYDLFTNLNLDNNKNYDLENNHHHFHIYKDKYTHILSDKKLDLRTNLDIYKSLGINVFRLELFDETSKDLEYLLKNLNKKNQLI